MTRSELRLLDKEAYANTMLTDPLKFYYWPVIGKLYRKRIELCLDELAPGQRILEIGFGSGITFLNLAAAFDEIYGIDLDASVEETQSVFQKVGITTELCNGNILESSYEDNFFDSVLAISIFEHLKPEELPAAFSEIRRILKPNGQLVYGAPVDRPFMTFAFSLLGYKIDEFHFSTEKQIAETAKQYLFCKQIKAMKSGLNIGGEIYQIGHFVKK